MKKRIVCVLLTFIMLIGLLPTAAVTAFAASNLAASEKAVKLIKDFEGFRAEAYEDGMIDKDTIRYSIGYGTLSTKGATITEPEADAELRAELKEVDKAINSFASAQKLTFTQAQHDALVSFSYNCGTGWMTASGRFRDAITDGKTGNDFLSTICLWSNVGSTPSEGLLKRRLCEANLYLNGQYSTTAPSNYTYVILNPNGGSAGEDKTQGYNTNVPVAISAVPTYAGYRFMGWYTAKDGGSYVTVLDSTTAGKTLYAHWQAEDGGKDEDGNIVGTKASYTISGAQAASLTVYKTPSTTAEKSGTVSKTDTLSVVAEYIDSGNVKWVQLKTGGWLSLGNVEDPIVLLTNVTVTVTGTYINVRSGAGTTNAAIGKVNMGDKLTITQVTTVNGSLWGRFEKGWVALMYTDYDKVINSSVSGEVIATGTVVCSSYVNVRSGAGVSAAQVGKVANGTKVNIYEITAVNSHDWGRISTGWICLDYVKLDATTDSSDKETDKETDKDSGSKTVVTATVKSDIDSVNIVKEPASTEVLGAVKSGEKVTILEQDETKAWGKVTVGSVTGWINLAFVDVKEETVVTTQSGVVANTDKVNIRSAAGVGNPLVTTLTRGTKVTIYEQVTKDNAPWAKIDQGWICMYYVELTSTGSGGTGSGSSGGSSGGSTLPEGAIGTGVVNSNTNLNVRTGPGTTNAKITSLPRGTSITIYEKTTTNGAEWGRIKVGDKDGWVCLSYVTMNTTSGGSGSSGTSDAEGTMGTVVNCSVAVNIRSAAGISNALVGTAPVGSRVKVYEQQTVNNVKWGRIDRGWVCMDYIKLDTPTSDAPSGGNGGTTNVTGTVTAETLKVFKEASESADSIATLTKGVKVTILEQKTDGEKQWGKIAIGTASGWIDLSGVKLDAATEEPSDPGSSSGSGTAVAAGVVANTEVVNIRSAAGVRNALVTTLKKGTRVNIYEQVTQDNAPWARIDQGWICMYYVDLDSTSSGGSGTGSGSGSTVPADAIGTGYVNSNVDLNVRTGPGTTYAKVTALKKGTKVTVYEQQLKDGMIWGRIDQGWVCMSYVTMTSTTNTGTGVMGTIARCFHAVNVRSAPGVGNALVGTILVGSRVEIYEVTTYSGTKWGRVAQGWISMDYVLLDSELPPVPDTGTGTDTDTDKDTDTDGDTDTDKETVENKNPEVAYKVIGIIQADSLIIRKDATTSSDKVGTFASGKGVNITALKSDGTSLWGKVTVGSVTGWINLNYVQLWASGTVTDDTTIFETASADSKEKASLEKNSTVSVSALALNGETVWGKVTVGDTTGWIKMSRVEIAEREIPAIVGSWRDEETLTGKDIGLDGLTETFTCNVTFTFNRDGSFSFRITPQDQNAVKQFYRAYLIETIYASYEDASGEEADGISRDEIDAIYKEVNQKTIAEAVDEALADINFAELFEALTVTGTYELDGEKLTLCYADDSFDDEVCTYSISGDILTLTDSEGDSQFDRIS